jgi:hypothetical protein
VTFGGAYEITISLINHDTKLAGVISTNPSYVMNSTAEGLFPLPVALVGRVPTQVLGPINKGDLVTSSDLPGIASRLSLSNYKPGCVLGKSLEDHLDTTVKTIEIVVGRY